MGIYHENISQESIIATCHEIMSRERTMGICQENLSGNESREYVMGTNRGDPFTLKETYSSNYNHLV
jgi:hypothetical protein